MQGNGSTQPASVLELLTSAPQARLDAQARSDIIAEVAAGLRTDREFPIEVLRSPSEADRQRAVIRIGQLTGQAVRRRSLSGVDYIEEQQLAAEIARRLLGLGFLDLLLPPTRTDVVEIAIDPFGTIWLKRKGVREFEPADISPDLVEVDTVFSNLLGAQLKAASEANPSVNAKLPRTRHIPGGGRIKYIHSVITPGLGYPSINIRLFEPAPVRPERLLEWGMLDEPTLDLLAQLVRGNRRGFICGGTASGKTTMLSMLCNFLPVQHRIVTIEDPQEIWIDNPHVVTLEARPAGAASELKPYLLRDGVDDAMRLTPDYLVVGEVRDGLAAQALFRAMMSDHPGMSTFHAESPELAVERVALLLEADTNTRERAARKMFASAVDWLLQVGFDHDGQRRVFGLVEVTERLRDGDVQFRRLVHYDGSGHWKHLAKPERQRGYAAPVPERWRDVLALDAAERDKFRLVMERRSAFHRSPPPG
ncbi:MAG: CpaF family protein [Anaerolineales bacterium]|nr:CpaF family protein [Anaerolineales bacterium]